MAILLNERAHYFAKSKERELAEGEQLIIETILNPLHPTHSTRVLFTALAAGKGTIKVENTNNSVITTPVFIQSVAREAINIHVQQGLLGSILGAHQNITWRRSEEDDIADQANVQFMNSPIDS